MGAACELLHKELGVVRRVRAAVLRGPRAAGAARVPLRAQQYRSCVMIILRTSRLWVRARAAALVVLEAVREDVHESYRWLRRARSRAGRRGHAGSTLPRMRALMPTQRRTAMWMSRCARARHSKVGWCR